MKSLSKTLLMISGAMLVLISQSCIARKASKVSKFNSPVELTLNESMYIPRQRKELVLRLVSLEDNRCPENVQCIVAGSATAEIKLIGRNGTEILRKLVLTGSKMSDTISISLNNTDYWVILKDVNKVFTNRVSVIVRKGSI